MTQRTAPGSIRPHSISGLYAVIPADSTELRSELDHATLRRAARNGQHDRHDDHKGGADKARPGCAESRARPAPA